MASFDVAAVRAQFPALKKSEWVYMDNAGGSQTLGTVAARVSDYLLTDNVQTGATYGPSVHASARVREGQQAAAELFNAPATFETFFASSATMAVQNLASAMAPTITKDDEIIVTNFDHEANIGAWVRMAEARGATVKFWEIDPKTLRPSLETLKGLLSPKTRLVTCTHASNILGTIHDVAAVAALVHTIPGAEILVDGVAYSPHRRIDVEALGVDYYVISVYKLYGPHFSVFFGRRTAVARLTSINHFFTATGQPEQQPYKLQAGCIGYELISSLPAIVDYITSLARQGVPYQPAGGDRANDRAGIAAALQAGFDVIEQQEQVLMDRLMPYLIEQHNQGTITIIGEPTADQKVRVPTVSFVVQGRKSSSIPPLVDAHKIGIRWGHFCSKRLIDSLGLAAQDGVIRVSLVHYNTVEEVDRFVAVLRAILASPAADAPTEPAKGGYGL